MRRVNWLSAVLVLCVAAAAAQAGYTVYVDPTIGVSYQEAQENAFLAAAGPLTTIGFDEWPNNTYLAGNEYAGLGAVFYNPQNKLGIASDLNYTTFTSRSPHCVLGPDAGTVAGDEDLQVTLTPARPAVSLWLIDSEFTAPGFAESVDFFDAANQLIASVPMPRTDYVNNGTDGNFFMGLISDVPIGRVVMHDAIADQVETVAWDTVRFTVPEPGALGLLVLAAVAGLRRRA
jgi:hypothetical protein